MNLNLSDLVWQLLAKNDSCEYRLFLSEKLKMDLNRINGLYEFICDRKPLKYPEKIDIQAYLVKSLVENESCLNLFPKSHEYSKGDLYSYDPAKNGQNILKHGLSFNEVIGNSKSIPLVALKLSTDGVRGIAFSDLKSLNNKNSLCFPLSKVNSNSYVLNVVSFDQPSGYRMISSRQLSSKPSKYTETIKSALKEEGVAEGSLRDFADRCVKYLEENIFCKDRSDLV